MPCPVQIKDNIIKEINEMSGDYTNKSPSFIKILQTTINNRFKTPVVIFVKQNDDTYLSNIKIPQSLIDEYYKDELIIEGDKEDYYQNVDNEVKPGVLELFDSNSELDNIGTPELYSKYLDTIFPNSQVKDIVYHGTEDKFDKFDIKYFGKNDYGDLGKGFYFAFDKASIFNEPIVISAIVNDIEAKTSPGYEIMIPKSEQIHILGSKQDIKGFKDFINNKNYNTKNISNSIFNEYGVTPEEWNNASESEREMIIWQSKNQC